MTIVIAMVLGVVGVLVGAVINALADELPARRSPQMPQYPDGTPRPPSAWLGLSAFLTGQRVSPADPESRLSWRHPIVELATGIGFAAMVLGFSDEQNLWAWLVYFAIMMLITVIDVEHRLILIIVIVPSCAFAILVAVLSPDGDKATSEYLYGGLVGFVLFLVLFLGGVVFVLVSRHEGVAFGFGDVMLATLSGFILGWKGFIVAAWITVFAGAAGALLYLIARAIVGRRYEWFTPLPYGPYIVIGTLSVLMFGEQLKDVLWKGSDFF
jgi:prepilin signal peptidase PulO-like enzyme (type II secretory pathway)